MAVQNQAPWPAALATHVAGAGRCSNWLLRLVELQADAGIPAGDRDFAGYVANVLFDDWDDEWADAPRAGCRRPRPLCARVAALARSRSWGLRLPAADYVNNDLNLSNVLTDGTPDHRGGGLG